MIGVTVGAVFSFFFSFSQNYFLWQRDGSFGKVLAPKTTETVYEPQNTLKKKTRTIKQKQKTSMVMYACKYSTRVDRDRSVGFLGLAGQPI